MRAARHKDRFRIMESSLLLFVERRGDEIGDISVADCCRR